MKRLLAVLAAVGACTLSGCGHDSAPAQKHNDLVTRVKLSDAAVVAVEKVTVRITSSDPTYVIPALTDDNGADGFSVVFPQLRVTGLTGPTYRIVAEARDSGGVVRYRGQMDSVNVLASPNPTTLHIVANSTTPVEPTDRVPARITGVQANDLVRSGETLDFRVAYNADATAPVVISWQQVGASNPTAAFSAANEAVTTWTAPTTSVALTETISVSVSNGVGAADTFTFQVSVSAKIDVPVEVTLNDAPVIASMALSSPRVAPAGTITFSVVASDPDGDALTYAFTTNGCPGSLSNLAPESPQATYTAGIDRGVICKLSVVVADGKGLSAQGLVTVVIDDAPPARTFTMTPTTPYTLANTAGVADDAAPGFGTGSIRASIADGAAKGELYFLPAQLFGKEITLGDILRVSYFTKKGTLLSENTHDWFFTLYTKPYAGQTSGWYGARITSELYFAGNRNEERNAWNLWSTDGAENFLRFYESTYRGTAFEVPAADWGSDTDPDWFTFVEGMSLDRDGALAGGRSSLAYAQLPVLYITLQTATGNAGFAGQLDGFEIALTDGTVVRVDFEAGHFTVNPALYPDSATTGSQIIWNADGSVTLQKDDPATAANLSIAGPRQTLSTLSFDHVDGVCGGGAPRINVRFEGSTTTYFFACDRASVITGTTRHFVPADADNNADSTRGVPADLLTKPMSSIGVVQDVVGSATIANIKVNGVPVLR